MLNKERATETTNKSSLQVTDEQSASVQKTSNRVTLDHIEANINQVRYYNPEIAPHFTIVFLKFDNGYIVTGQSAPADPENYNEELGKKFAYEEAIRKVWPLFGFALCEKLTEKE